MTIAQEEIWPVLAAIPYENRPTRASPTIRIRPSGLWTGSARPRHRTPRRTGTYNVNFFMMAMTSPFGGFKASGLGRELGPEGLRAYLEPKTICFAPGSEPS
jgi:betaine-aldehyde dehydrogenase